MVGATAQAKWLDLACNDLAASALVDLDDASATAGDPLVRQPERSGTGLSPEDGPRAHLCSAGQQFGPGGETWLRFNSATLRPILKEALERG